MTTWQSLSLRISIHCLFHTSSNYKSLFAKMVVTITALSAHAPARTHAHHIQLLAVLNTLVGFQPVETGECVTDVVRATQDHSRSFILQSVSGRQRLACRHIILLALSPKIPKKWPLKSPKIAVVNPTLI